MRTECASLDRLGNDDFYCNKNAFLGILARTTSGTVSARCCSAEPVNAFARCHGCRLVTDLRLAVVEYPGGDCRNTCSVWILLISAQKGSDSLDDSIGTLARMIWFLFPGVNRSVLQWRFFLCTYLRPGSSHCCYH